MKGKNQKKKLFDDKCFGGNSMEKEIASSVAKALDRFAELLDLCREEIVNLTLVEERTYEYAIGRAYSKVLLTACEIYILLSQGFPEGAFALSRSLYEALVIISTLLEGKRNDDQLLIEKFFDAAEITTIKINLDRAKWVSDNVPHHALAHKAKEETVSKLQSYKDKYNRKDFKDYWWANADSFTKLAERSGFSKAPMYSRVSGNVHFNAYDVFTYIDTEEQCVLIGETYKGLELPLWFTSHCLHCICGLLHGSYPILVSESLLEKTRQCVEQFSKLHQDEINSKIVKLNV